MENRNTNNQIRVINRKEKNMNQREEIVKVMKSWIGKKEADGTHKEIIDIYNAHKPLARGYKVKYTDSWCAATVSAAAIKCGLTDIIPTECSCQKMIELLKKMGSWVEDDGYTPQGGDIIFYDWGDSGKGDNTGGSDHVGIVEKCKEGKISVIEGNKSDAVGRRTINVNGKYIRGFGVPKYDECSKDESVSSVKTISIGSIVKYSGKWQYLSSGSCGLKRRGKACDNATVTKIKEGKVHPYHLIGTGVYGWVNAGDITTMEQ